MHSRRKGKSGSKKPLDSNSKNWCRYQSKEVESLVLKLAKSEKKSAQIGLMLRDTYGIPSVKAITGKRINQILKENNLVSELPDDLFYLIKKDIKIMKQLENNKQDQVGKKALMLNGSKINRLVKYYKRTKKLDRGWLYEQKTQTGVLQKRRKLFTRIFEKWL